MLFAAYTYMQAIYNIIQFFLHIYVTGSEKPVLSTNGSKNDFEVNKWIFFTRVFVNVFILQ